MEKLKVSKAIDKALKVLKDSKPNHIILDLHKERWETDRFSCLNELSYDQMQHALTYGFEVDEIPNYDELKGIIEYMIDGKLWTFTSLLSTRREREFKFESKGKPLNKLTYEQLKRIINRMDKGKRTKVKTDENMQKIEPTKKKMVRISDLTLKEQVENVVKSLINIGCSHAEIFRRKYNDFQWKGQYNILNHVSYEYLEEVIIGMRNEETENKEELEGISVHALYTMVDIALDTGNKEWFMELTDYLNRI